jgi:hypothetical protein
MNPETSEVMMDAMQVHPDWNHIETLSIHPNCDTLIIVPGHALFRSKINVKSPDFDPMQRNVWSLNEFQDDYEVRLMVEHVHMGVLTAAHVHNSIVVLSGGCTRAEGEGWTEGESYYEVAEYYNWWQDETKVPLYLMKAKAFVDVYACNSMDNLWMSANLFRQVHPRKEVPKKVIVVGYGFKKKRFTALAKIIGIPEFEYIEMEDPVNFAVDALAVGRENSLIESFALDPFGEDFNSTVGKQRMKRNMMGRDYPYGTGNELIEIYRKQFQRRKANHSQ